ncbi:hypothetical protein BDP27DRAFT_1366332 [Rhodocollybia butyracea]|uniref:Uncharacterized protein n=1 Tax=Rhodocollybia butyracea TaxID=206335 RepID=A0A9P5PHN8_9AGAR|nr:hypothetical protein BDP27DRAFT_1366332 [Rhodocollybia butyracea]
MRDIDITGIMALSMHQAQDQKYSRPVAQANILDLERQPSNRKKDGKISTTEDDKLVKYAGNTTLEYGGPGDDVDCFIAPVRKECPGFYIPVVRHDVLLFRLLSIDRRYRYCYNAFPFQHSLGSRPPMSPVEYYTGYWHIWENGPLSAPIPPKGTCLSSLHRHQGQSLSDASASLATGLLKRDDYYPIPLSLLQHEFAAFSQNVVFGPLDQDKAPSLTGGEAKFQHISLLKTSESINSASYCLN